MIIIKRVNTIVKHFEMMGYDVRILEDSNYIEVSLKTRGGFETGVFLSFDDLKEDFIIEHVVKQINNSIKEEIY